MAVIDPIKQEFLDLIDSAKNKLIDPVLMLKWTYLRLLILEIPDQEFLAYMDHVFNNFD